MESVETDITTPAISITETVVKGLALFSDVLKLSLNRMCTIVPMNLKYNCSVAPLSPGYRQKYRYNFIGQRHHSITNASTTSTGKL